MTILHELRDQLTAVLDGQRVGRVFSAEWAKAAVARAEAAEARVKELEAEKREALDWHARAAAIAARARLQERRVEELKAHAQDWERSALEATGRIVELEARLRTLCEASEPFAAVALRIDPNDREDWYYGPPGISIGQWRGIAAACQAAKEALG